MESKILNELENQRLDLKDILIFAAIDTEGAMEKILYEIGISYNESDLIKFKTLLYNKILQGRL